MSCPFVSPAILSLSLPHLSPRLCRFKAALCSVSLSNKLCYRGVIKHTIGETLMSVVVLFFFPIRIQCISNKPLFQGISFTQIGHLLPVQYLSAVLISKKKYNKKRNCFSIMYLDKANDCPPCCCCCCSTPVLLLPSSIDLSPCSLPPVSRLLFALLYPINLLMSLLLSLYFYLLIFQSSFLTLCPVVFFSMLW